MPKPSSADRRGSVIAGIGFAAAAYFLFSLHDATIKWLVADISAPQILLLRSAVVLPFCVAIEGPWVVVRGFSSPVRMKLVWRSLVLVAAWICYYSAARYLQLAELTTIYFSSPLLVAVLAIPLLKERVTWARWGSLGIGFAGVIIACRPHDVHQVVPIVLALVAAALWAYTTILVRQIVSAVSTPVLLFMNNLVILLACATAMPWVWHTPTLPQLSLMVLVGLLGAAGQFMSTEGIRRAPATVVAPISFSSLLWSFCLGLAIWGDLPDFGVFLGAGLILLSGLLVAGAEWRATRALGGLP